MLGPVTSGINLAPVTGNRYPGPVYSNARGVAPIDPTTVPDVLRVMYYSYPWPQNTFTTYPYTGNSCSPTQPVVVCVDQWATFNVSPSDYDRVANVGPPPDPGPLFEDEGIEFDTIGVQDLVISNTPVQTGLTAFTAYLWGTLVDGAIWVPLGHTSQTAIICLSTTSSNGPTIVDDAGTEVDVGAALTPGKVLLRVSVDGSGNWSIIGTGISENTGTAAFTTFSFNQTGNSFGNTILNSDLGNRHMGQIIVDRVIALNSPEDLGIRAGINAGTYTGKGGYSLDGGMPPSPPGFNRPDGVSIYHRPDGTSTYYS